MFKGVVNTLNIPRETAVQVIEFWKLKRKANFNRHLITPKQEEAEALAEAAETGLQRRLRMFTHLRYFICVKFPLFHPNTFVLVMLAEFHEHTSLASPMIGV